MRDGPVMSSRDAPPADPGPPQAVVIIHGIGEQRPMATLRSFVSALLDRQDDRPGDRYHSKPDMISESYELRRIKLRRAQPDRSLPNGLNLDWPETDFYEYYWAHQMYGTKASHVVRWLFATMWRSRRFIRPADNDYPRLAILAWLMVAITALFGAIATVLWLGWDGLHLPASAAGAGAIVLGLGYGVLRYAPQSVLGAVLDVVGDAARYFDVNPKNVARRYDILRGGIALLRKLHEDRDVRGDSVIYRYGRVVLVGHSLGSVIAYDILRHYWAEVNGQTPVNHAGDEITGVEGFVAPKQSDPPPEAATYVQPDRYRRAQSALWKAISDRVPAKVQLSLRELWRRRASVEPWRAPAPVGERAAREEPPEKWQPARWLVSDLVTVGSPLAYAPVLLAAGIADLNEKLRLRELPTCPPDRSRHVNPGHHTVLLSTEANRFDDYHILHHGACFASTRWTNLWYPNDPVGGPLGPAFGGGILDIPLPDTFWPLQSHIKYWPTPQRRPAVAQRHPRPRLRRRFRARAGDCDVATAQAKSSTQILDEILRSGNESAAQSFPPTRNSAISQ